MERILGYLINLIILWLRQKIRPNASVLYCGPNADELREVIDAKLFTAIGGLETRNHCDELIKASSDEQAKYDYILLVGLLHTEPDIQEFLKTLRVACHEDTRIYIFSLNFLWMPFFRFLFCFFKNIENINWLSRYDISALLDLENYALVTWDSRIMVPFPLWGISSFLNRYVARLPVLRHFNLVIITTARVQVVNQKQFSISVIIPAKNESGNIENAIKRLPDFGSQREIIFVEGGSEDNTFEEMQRVKQAYPAENITIYKQEGKGKADAVRMGFRHANCEVLMILDADLTTPPEDMLKFYQALIDGKGEFVNGCRLVYPLEKDAMRFLNMIANRFFAFVFSYLLGQTVKDTLCGTKVLFKKDYDLICQRFIENYGFRDPFGDFELLFGAAFLDLQIVEIPVRYRRRVFGETQIRRFYHGLQLMKMLWPAAKIFKFH